MILFIKYLLIVLVALPVLVFAFYLWMQLRKYVKRRNLADEVRYNSIPSGKSKRRKRRK